MRSCTSASVPPSGGEAPSPTLRYWRRSASGKKVRVYRSVPYATEKRRAIPRDTRHRRALKRAMWGHTVGLLNITGPSQPFHKVLLMWNTVLVLCVLKGVGVFERVYPLSLLICHLFHQHAGSQWRNNTSHERPLLFSSCTVREIKYFYQQIHWLFGTVHYIGNLIDPFVIYYFVSICVTVLSFNN